jgi:hypothetical protein
VRDLTVDDFSGRINDRFGVSFGGASLELVLVEAEGRRADDPGRRAPFTLLFHGPPAPVLPQSIHRLEHPALGPLDLFMVPVGPEAGRMRYEVIFG